mgnify:CR=1 FL=1
MNNIGYLRKRLDLTYRSLEKECGIDRSTLNLLEKGKQKLTEARIDTLCSFFKVSSDFLLGKSDYGIIVEIKSGFTSISKDDYERYLSQGLLKEYDAVIHICLSSSLSSSFRNASAAAGSLSNVYIRASENALCGWY